MPDLRPFLAILPLTLLFANPARAETMVIDATAGLAEASPLGTLTLEQSVAFGTVTWPRSSDGKSCRYNADPAVAVDAFDQSFADIDPVTLGCERKAGSPHVGIVTLSCTGDSYSLSIDASNAGITGARVEMGRSSRNLQVDGVGVESASLKCAEAVNLTVAPDLRLWGSPVVTDGEVKVGTVLIIARFD